MKQKSVVILSIVTAAALGVAAVALRAADPEAAHNAAGRVFPELQDRINDVAEVQLEKDGESATLKRVDGKWQMADRGGYPAKVANVKELAVRVAGLEIEESKTARKENHARLGLEWPPRTDGDGEGDGMDAADGEDDDAESEIQAGRVTLKDASGTTLASLIVGRTEWEGSKPKVFVRRADEDQVYLCEPLGALDILPAANKWIEPKFVELTNDRVQGVTIEHADGERVEIARSVENHTQFAVQNLPPGENERYAGVASSVAQALGSGLQLEDVRPASEVDFAAEPLAKTRYRTTDGLELVVETARFEEKVWVKVAASYTPPPEPPATEEAAEEPPAEGAPPAGEEGAADEPAAEDAHDHAADEDAAHPEAAPEAEEAPEEDKKDVAKEVAELNERLAPWAFEVSTYRSDVLTRRMKDLVAEPDPAATGDGGLEGLLEDMGADEAEEAVEPPEGVDDEEPTDPPPTPDPPADGSGPN